MIELTLLMPQKQDPHPMKEEDFFLWQSESPVLEDAAEPGEAEAQEIAIYPEGKQAAALRLLFNTREAALQDRIAGLANSLYAMYGSAGPRALANGIMDPPVTTWDPSVAPRAPLKPPLRGEPVYRGETTPKRHALLTAYKSHKKILDSFIARAEERIQAKAREVVKARLDKIHQQLLRERIRYRVTPQGATNHAPEVNADLGSLAQAMWEIDVLRRELEYFNELNLTAAQHIPGTGYYGPSYAAFINRAELAEKDRRLVQETLAGKLAGHCRRHPILYRLWNHEVVPEVADAWGNALPKDKQDKVAYSTKLFTVIDDTLDQVQQAGGLMETELNETPEVVWRYSPVINDALKLLHLGQGDMAWMVAQEKLAAFKGAMGPFAKLSIGIGIVEELAAMAAATPPTAALLAAASLASSIGEVIESALEEGKKDLAFSACLDPADSFAAEQGSYVGSVVGALFLILQLRGMGGIGGPP